MEFTDHQLNMVTNALSKNHFLELLVAFSLKKDRKDLKWHVKPLSRYLRISQGKTYELLREASKFGLLRMEKAKVPMATGEQTVKVFMKSDLNLIFNHLQGGNGVLRIKVGKETPIRNFEIVRSLFSVFSSKPFRISCTSIRSTYVYFTLKKLQEEWKRNRFPNLRGAWYAQVLKPLEELPPEFWPLEKSAQPKKNALVFRENKTRRRPPIYYRFRYAKVILEFSQDQLPTQFKVEENGVVSTAAPTWDIFPKS